MELKMSVIIPLPNDCGVLHPVLNFQYQKDVDSFLLLSVEIRANILRMGGEIEAQVDFEKSILAVVQAWHIRQRESISIVCFYDFAPPHGSREEDVPLKTYPFQLAAENLCEESGLKLIIEQILPELWIGNLMTKSGLENHWEFQLFSAYIFPDCVHKMKETASGLKNGCQARALRNEGWAFCASSDTPPSVIPKPSALAGMGTTDSQRI